MFATFVYFAGAVIAVVSCALLLYTTRPAVKDDLVTGLLGARIAGVLGLLAAGALVLLFV